MFEWFDGGQMISALPHVICAIIGWELGRWLRRTLGDAISARRARKGRC